MGKNIGDDLAEGKPTLPLICALKNSSGTTAQMIRDAITNGGKEHMQEILQVIRDTDAIAYTEEVANQQAEIARREIECLADNPYRNALLVLTDFAITRVA